MRRGLAVEPIARRLYQEQTGIPVAKAGIGIHSVLHFVRASLDIKGHLTELKGPGIRVHCMALNSEAPRHYLWQLIHQMAVENRDEINYFSLYLWKDLPENFKVPDFKDWQAVPKEFRPEGFETWQKIPSHLIWNRWYLDRLNNLTEYLALNPLNYQIVTFKRDKNLEDFLLEAEIKFWEFVTKDIPPPKDFMKDKPKLKLVTQEPSFFKVKSHRATSAKQARAIVRKKQIRSKPMSENNSGRYTPEELIKILERAKELGVIEMRLPGYDVVFRPQVANQPQQGSSSAEQQIPPRSEQQPEFHQCQQCGAPAPMGQFGPMPLCESCFSGQQQQQYYPQPPRPRYRRPFYPSRYSGYGGRRY